MRRIFGFLLIFLFFLTPLGFAQDFPQDFLKAQEEYLNKLKKENPTLYGFEKRLLEIQRETQGIVQDYQKGKNTKAQTREKLTPLIKEELELRSNPDYLIEQRLSMLFSVGSLGAAPLLPVRAPASSQ